MDIRHFFTDAMAYREIELSMQPGICELTGSLIIDRAFRMHDLQLENRRLLAARASGVGGLTTGAPEMLVIQSDAADDGGVIARLMNFLTHSQ